LLLDSFDDDSPSPPPPPPSGSPGMDNLLPPLLKPNVVSIPGVPGATPSQNLTLRKKASVCDLSCALTPDFERYVLAITVSPRGDRMKKFVIMVSSPTVAGSSVDD